MTQSLAYDRPSVRMQALATFVALVAAVALPQVFHAVGALVGVNSALGEVWLPMHLPIILVGLLAGPYAGGIAGVLAPLVSFATTGMPTVAMLPFMMVELCVYGVVAGLLRAAKMPTLAKVLAAQVAGRVVRAALIVAANLVLGLTTVGIPVIWTSIIVGIPGLVLQWALIPVVVRLVEKGQECEL